MSSHADTDVLRRSKRLKEKKIQSERDPPLTGQTIVQTESAPKTTGSLKVNSNKNISTRKTVNSKNSQASRIRRAELQNAIKKKQLEQEEIKRRQELLDLEQEEIKRRQELLDLELALRLEEIEEDSQSNDSELSVHESEHPNMEDWIGGKNPWGEKHTVQYSKTKTDEVREPFYCNPNIPSTSKVQNEMTLPQVSTFLSRQSLPKELPLFDGNPMDWPNFINQYRNSNTLCGYSNEENQFRLQKCLKGNAKKVVQSLLIMPQNVEKVIKLLESRFGRSEQIIFVLLDKIKKFPNIKEDKLELFVEFSDEIKNFVAILECLNEVDHLRNPILITDILNKLPTSYKLLWIEHVSKIVNPNSKLVELSNWLDEKANNMTQINFQTFTDSYQNHSKFNKTKKDVTMTTQITVIKCFCCNEDNHHLSFCKKFKSLPTDERWSLITTKKICFSCLLPNHNIKTCKKRKTCGIGGCNKPHHELLHKDPISRQDNPTTVDSSETVTRTNCHISTNKNVLLKILPVCIFYCDKRVQTYALLDDASTITLIDQSLADEIGMTGPSQSLCLQWTNEDVVHHQNDSKVVSFTISGIDNGSKFQLRHVRTTRLSLPSQTIDVDKLKNYYPNIIGKISSMEHAQPKIIIGQDNWPLLVNRQLIKGPWSGPAISKTLLGWVLHGNLEEDSPKPIQNNVVCYIQSNDNKTRDDLDILHDLVKEQWKLESISSKRQEGLSPEDRHAQNILDMTMKRVGNRYETGLLWKSDNTVMPESKTNAFKRLCCTERKMDRNKEYAEKYCQKFEEFVNKGYIRKLSKDEACITSNLTWYLPHFGVINTKKPDKLRIVFDASAVSNNVSLNDCLLPGPDLYNSLQDILLNFRIKKYAFTADIKEMFLQVQVRKEDRQAQRLLWRGMDRDREPDVYEIGVVFFGSTSGPCLAQEAKNRNAKDHEDNFPTAVHDIIYRHYMDDYLGGADSKDETIQLIKNIIFVHKQGGFNICNWIANDKDILDNIHPDLVAEIAKKFDNHTKTATERILGVFWNPKEDIFKFETKYQKIDADIFENRRRPTKREILKILMSVFDPLGFLSHILIHGKLLLQDIWRSKIGWDDEITSNMNEKWTVFLNDLKCINQFKISRQYFTLDRTKSDIQLHVFVDASETCYATVAYLRIQQENEVEVAFVSARTRVSSLRPLSVPRLELQGALLGARLGHYLKNSLNLELSNVFYWCDSKTVLHWIRSEARRFKVFISHRLGEIQELTNTADWKYVNSKDNAADEATKRRTSLVESRWLHGPKFLLDSPDNWPKENSEHSTVDLETLEIRPNNFVFILHFKENNIIPDVNRFSKWLRLLRSTAYVLRMINFLKTREMVKGELSIAELDSAENILFKKVQEDAFSNEIATLKDKKALNSKNRLYELSCIYSEEDGLIRLSGRLDKSSELGIDTKRPIVLDPDHRITRLLIQRYHEEVYHHGQEIVINNLRQRFWILRMRQAVRSIWNSCQWCKNRRATPTIPQMGQLPTCRIEPTIRPFIRTGVDYFGPLEVPVKRSKEKRYGVIFTCMATRAVYLEIAHDLTSSSFINVLRQMGCRRGFPEELFCDCGSNFIGGNKELSKHLETLLKDKDIQNYLILKRIKVIYNPPLAPNMGGSWERLIQSTKKILKEMLTTKSPPEHILRTFFAECENILNSRPLTHVSLDSYDSESLTPNHFLIGPNYAALPCMKSCDTDLNLMSSWRAAQRLADIFWSRWTREYLPSLIKRTKWYEQKRSIQRGDVVIMVDPNGYRNNWQRGIVVRLYPAKDGVIRIVDVKNSSGAIFRRPVSKLIVLDVKILP